MKRTREPYTPPFKAASEFFSRLLPMSDEERLSALEASRGRELAALLHYLEGCERVTAVEQLMGMVLMIAGERYLAKQAAKAAKRMKKAKEIL
jgi:hypothetical protein